MPLTNTYTFECDYCGATAEEKYRYGSRRDQFLAPSLPAGWDECWGLICPAHVVKVDDRTWREWLQERGKR